MRPAGGGPAGARYLLRFQRIRSDVGEEPLRQETHEQLPHRVDPGRRGLPDRRGWAGPSSRHSPKALAVLAGLPYRPGSRPIKGAPTTATHPSRGVMIDYAT